MMTSMLYYSSICTVTNRSTKEDLVGSTLIKAITLGQVFPVFNQVETKIVIQKSLKGLSCEI
jgi:hypothetical protein